VNVFNADELELDVLVKILIFVPFAGSPVSHGIYLREKIAVVSDLMALKCASIP